MSATSAPVFSTAPEPCAGELRRLAALGIAVLLVVFLELVLVVFDLPGGESGSSRGGRGPLMPVNAPVTLRVGAEAPRAERVLLFGGSTMLGFPYEPRVTTVHWLAELLRELRPDLSWELEVRAGRAYGSKRVLEEAGRAPRSEGAIWLVMTGHNEFLPVNRRYLWEDRLRGAAREAEGLFDRLRIYKMLRRLLAGLGRRSEVALKPAEVITTADAEYARVVEHYERNLRRLVRLARRRGARLILCGLVSNLRDWRPNRSLHGGLAAEDVARFEERRGRLMARRMAGDPPGSAEWRELTRISPDHAESWFELGRAQLREGDVAGALRSFERARDLDAIPWRAPGPILERLQRVAREEGVPLVDVMGAFLDRSARGIPGYDLLADNVHPNLEGYHLLAVVMARAIQEHGGVDAPLAWRWAALPSAEPRPNSARRASSWTTRHSPPGSPASGPTTQRPPSTASRKPSPGSPAPSLSMPRTPGRRPRSRDSAGRA
jgi:lysophospholipase L1-like esterase